MNPTDATPNSKSPAEDFAFTVEKYAVWNSGHSYSTASAIPDITIGKISETYGDATYESGTETKHDGDRMVTVTLPTYNYVGDYWYKITETTGDTAGVYYGTNDVKTEDHTKANGDHNGVYYLHVQVTEAGSGDTSTLHRMVTLHKNAPESSLTNAAYNAATTQTAGQWYAQEDTNKVNAIENKYFAGDLEIQKHVTGSGGDKKDYFEVTVVFTMPTNRTVKSDILFSAYANDEDTSTTNFVIKGSGSSEDYTGKTVLSWNDTTATATFWIKNEQTVTFTNIPYGVTYAITDALPENDNYQHTLVVSDQGTTKLTSFNSLAVAADTSISTLTTTTTGAGGTATGTINSEKDHVDITNEKNVTIDIGVITENAPYITLLTVAGAALILLIARKKRASEV